MKRLCSIIMVLLLCLAMAVPVFAAEQQEYVFELMPSISMLGSFDFVYDGGSFYYEGRLPEGMYQVTFCWYPSSVVSFNVMDEPVCINYSTEFEGFFASVHCFTLSNAIETVSFDFFLVDSYSELGASVLLCDFPVDSTSYGNPYFVFTPIENSWKLADYFNVDTLAATLDHLIALLPVILSVIVGYIGLRKAIGWMLSVLRSS